MDPVSLIVTALVEGAAGAVTEVATSAVADAYNGLKKRVSERLAAGRRDRTGTGDAEDLDSTDPAVLARTLRQIGVGTDVNLVEAASHLLSLLDENGTRAGAYNLDLSSAVGLIYGDVGTVVIGGGGVEPASGRGISWPLLVGLPPVRADAYQQRPVVPASTVSAARARGAGIATLIFSGDAGTGKTQLAAAEFGRFREGGVDLALWTSATSPAAVVSAYARAYAATHPADPLGGEDTLSSRLFLEWLATTNRSWIVVLDDIVDPGALQDLWPRGGHGLVLATTRRRDSAVAALGELVRIDVFTPDQAVGYLRTKLEGRPGSPANVLDGAAELAAELGQLPLGLSHAAAVIADEGLTCAQYRLMLSDRSQTLADLQPGHPRDFGDPYGTSLAAAWSLAIEHADSLSPSGVAHPTVEVAAVLDPAGAPEAVLVSGPTCLYVADHRTGVDVAGAAGTPPAVSARDVRRGLRNLHRLSIVKHDPNGGPRAVQMHALAQRAALERLEATQRAQVIRCAADGVLECWPKTTPDPALESALRANAASVAARSDDALIVPRVHPLLFRLGDSLGEAGLVGAAAAHFADLTSTTTRLIGADQPDTLRSRYREGVWTGEAGHATQAADVLAAAVQDCRRVLGVDHQLTLQTRHGLANWTGHAGQPMAAADLLEGTLADCRGSLGDEHPITLAVARDREYWRGVAGNRRGAFDETEALLPVLEKVLGPDDIVTLDTRENLARWRGDIGDAEGAAAAFERLYDDHLRVCGPTHPRTLAIRHGLAWWRGQAGDPGRAAADFRALLDDRLRVLGPDHPAVAVTRRDLATWLDRAP
jgi:hypothetical protein